MWWWSAHTYSVFVSQRPLGSRFGDQYLTGASYGPTLHSGCSMRAFSAQSYHGQCHWSNLIHFRPPRLPWHCYPCLHGISVYKCILIDHRFAWVSTFLFSGTRPSKHICIMLLKPGQAVVNLPKPSLLSVKSQLIRLPQSVQLQWWWWLPTSSPTSPAASSSTLEMLRIPSSLEVLGPNLSWVAPQRLVGSPSTPTPARWHTQAVLDHLVPWF